MNRRTLLAALAAASTGLGGCVGDDNGPSGGDGNDGGDGGDAPDDTEPPDGDAPNESPEGNETSRDGGDGEETDASTEPGPVSNRDFRRTDRCEEPGGASVEFLEGAVSVEGCVAGRNGCEEAALAAADYEGDAFVVVIETVEGDDEGEGNGNESDEVCTQALTHLGYAFRADFDGAAPRAVRVIHDDANGREAVVVAERDA